MKKGYIWAWYQKYSVRVGIKQLYGIAGPQSSHPQPGPQTDDVILKALPMDR